MTAHDHTSFIPGCFRFELSRDEVTPQTSTQPPRVEAEDAVSAETRHGRDSARPAAVGGGES